jgi:folylpolyglutamate synthase/dihydropteroate synthase
VDMAHQFGCLAHPIVPIEKAIQAAIDMAGKESAIVVAGSLFIAAAVREVLMAAPQKYSLDILRK